MRPINVGDLAAMIRFKTKFNLCGFKVVAIFISFGILFPKMIAATGTGEGIQSQAMASLLAGQYDDLIVNCQEWSKVDPGDPVPEFLLDRCDYTLSRSNKVDLMRSPWILPHDETGKIWAWLSAGLSKNPKNKELLLTAGAYFASKKDINAAEKFYLKAYRECGKDDMCYTIVGGFYRLNKKNLGAAKPFYDKAASLRQDNFFANFNLYSYYHDHKQNEKAMKYAMRCLNTVAKNQIVLFNQASIYSDMGYLGKRIEWYENILRISSTTDVAIAGAEPFVHPIPVIALEHLSLTELADLSERALLTDTYKFNQVLTLWMSRDPENPVAHFQKFVRDWWFRTGTFDSRGSALKGILADAKNHKKILEWLTNLTAKYPACREHTTNLFCDFYNYSGDFANGIEFAKRVIEMEPYPTAERRTDLAWAMWELGRTDEARQEIFRAIQIEPNTPKSYYIMAILEYRVGNMARAVPFLKKAIALDPTFVDATELLHTIESAVNGWVGIGEKGTEILLSDPKMKEKNAVTADYDLNSANWVEFCREDHAAVSNDDVFAFRLKWEGAPNTFEFKLIDQAGSNFGKKFPLPAPMGEWQDIQIPVKDLQHWWGGGPELDAQHIAGVCLAVSRGTGGSGRLTTSGFHRTK